MVSSWHDHATRHLPSKLERSALKSPLGDPKALATLVAAVLALIASLLSVFIGKRTQIRLASKQEALQRDLASKQDKLQRELASQQTSLQREIESAKDLLERARSFNTSTRDRIVERLDRALDAYAVLFAHSQLVGRSAWVERQGAAAIEDKVQSEASSLRSGLEFLKFMKAMPEPAYEQCATACSRVTWAWGGVMSELALKDGEDLPAERPASQEFSPSRFTERHRELRSSTDELGAVLFQSLTLIAVPV